MSDHDVLRERLQRAIGYEAPSPSFGMRPIADMAADRAEAHEGRPALIAVVAVLLAVAIVVTLVIGGRLLRLSPYVPVNVPLVSQVVHTSTSPCAAYGVEMSTTTTGWASGQLHTTDGGAHWARVSPPSISGRLPDGGSEVFGDANHAWVAQIAGPQAGANGEVVVFGTVDGGHTWSRSAAMAMNPAHKTETAWTTGGPATQMCFVDAQHGWLLTEAYAGFGAGAIGALYRTIDGGLRWTLLSSNPGGAAVKSLSPGCAFVGPMTFLSPTTGWMSTCGTSREWLVTRDGGLSWTLEQAPIPNSSLPVSIDSSHAYVVGKQDSLVVTPTVVLAMTADGGQTWSVRGLVPFIAVTTPANTVKYPTCLNFAFVDANHGWCEAGQQGFGPGVQLFRTTDGGLTWSRLGEAPRDASVLMFVNASTGYLAAYTKQDLSDWQLFKTVDGGVTWTRELKPGG